MSNRLTSKWMRLLAIFVCLFAFMNYTFAEKRPKVTFKEDVWDFGKVQQGKTLTHEFRFKNEGDATLVVQKVRTSCGCTAALVSEQEIAPGKEGRIKATFDSHSYAGRVTKYIYFDSNDPDQASKQLTITADVEVPPQPRIEINPYNLEVGLCLEGEEIQGKIEVENKGELELQVDGSHRDAKFFMKGKPVTFPLKIASGKKVDLELKIPSQNRSGVLREYILIRSNDPVRSTLSVYLSGYLISRQQLKELFTKYRDILKVS